MSSTPPATNTPSPPTTPLPPKKTFFSLPPELRQNILLASTPPISYYEPICSHKMSIQLEIEHEQALFNSRELREWRLRMIRVWGRGMIKVYGLYGRLDDDLEHVLYVAIQKVRYRDRGGIVVI